MSTSAIAYRITRELGTDEWRSTSHMTADTYTVCCGGRDYTVTVDGRDVTVSAS